VHALLGSIPSPGSGTVDLGPFTVHMYGLTLLLAIAVCVYVTGRRWIARGGDWDFIFRVAVWVSYWLERDQAQAIFLDYSLQPALYREARRRGATREQLHQWFQYPRGTGYPLGVIRHFRYHRDHFHVRFRCDDADEQCR
jgi:hypothetical protein